jgi:uncharacterized protein (TIGR02231 family)
MRLAITLLTALVASSASATTNVVVFVDRARVTRTRTVACTSARSASWTGLPERLDPRSLRARTTAGSGGKQEPLAVSWRRSAPNPRQIADVERELAALRATLARQDALARRLDGFRAQLHRTWGRQAAAGETPVERWSEALDLLRREGLAVAARRDEVGGKLRRLSARLERLRRAAGRSFEVDVRLPARCRGARTVELSYVVPAASWRMSYAARYDPEHRALTLEARAIVQQGTGEDWRDARVVVSTVDPTRGATPPRVEPVEVRAFEPVQTRKILSRRAEPVERLQAGRPPPGRRALRAMRLAAGGRATIPGDGREVLVPLASARLRDQRLTLEAAPRLSQQVFRRVSPRNPFAFPMIPGPVALFYDGTYLGRSRVERLRMPGEPLALSLGARDQLRVRRYVKVRRHVPPGALGSRRRLVRRLRLQVDNWTHAPQRVLVRESIPVSRVAEIRVRLDRATTRPTRHDRKDGFLQWAVRLPPRSKRTIDVAYTISLPRSYAVER